MSLPNRDPEDLAARLAVLEEEIPALAQSAPVRVDLMAHPIKWHRGPLVVAAPAETLLAVAHSGLADAQVLVVTPHAEVLGRFLDRVWRSAGPLPDRALYAAGEAIFAYQEEVEEDEAEGLMAAALAGIRSWIGAGRSP